MFGRGKKPEDRTFLVLDVESGSVGAALVRVSHNHAPKLFGEKRVHLPVLHTRDAAGLLQKLEHAAREALHHAAEVAARLRSHPKTAPVGTVSDASLFLHAPWGTPDLSAGIPHFADPAQESLERAIQDAFGVQSKIYTGAGAALHGHQTLFPYQESYLLCVVSAEVTELLLIQNGAPVAYATMPMGRNTPLRTLRSHGGYSTAEAQSLLRLNPEHEGLSAAKAHFGDAFADAAAELFMQAKVSEVVVVSQGAEGEWFARALSDHEGLADLFPSGGSVRAMKHTHAMPHFSAHAPMPDLSLMLEALFVATLKH